MTYLPPVKLDSAHEYVTVVPSQLLPCRSMEWSAFGSVSSLCVKRNGCHSSASLVQQQVHILVVAAAVFPSSLADV